MNPLSQQTVDEGSRQLRRLGVAARGLRLGAEARRLGFVDLGAVPVSAKEETFLADRELSRQGADAAQQPDAGDATVVSTVRGNCTPRGFGGRQEVAEWAPLIFVRYAPRTTRERVTRK